MNKDEVALWNILMDFVKAVSECTNCQCCKDLAHNYLGADILSKIEHMDQKEVDQPKQA